MDDFFDEIGVALLLVLFLTIMTEGKADEGEEVPEERLVADEPEPILQQKPVSYIQKSSNKKIRKPKTVYF